MVDGDRDGWDESTDCDDTDPLVHPEAEETCLNGIDDDCNDTIDHCALCSENVTSFSYGLAGVMGPVEIMEAPGDAVAWAVGWSESPGQADLVVSSRGALWPTSTISFDESEVPTALATHSDVDGDGLDDLVIVGGRLDSGDGAGWSFSGPIPDGSLESSEADATFWTPDEYLVGATSLRGVADAPEAADGFFLVGLESWIMNGPVSGSIDVSTDSRATLIADQPLTAAATDVDGDGLNDLLVGGADASETKQSNDRVVRVFLGPLPEPLDADNADRTWTDFGAGNELAAGDFDGDGRGDVVATAWPHASIDAETRAIMSLVTEASPNGSLTEGATASFEASVPLDVPQTTSTDFDGDDVADLVFAEPRTGGVPSNGTISILLGPFAGAYSVPSDANSIVASCKESWDVLGTSVTAGDYDLDGTPDIVTTSTLFSVNFGTPLSGTVRVMPSTLFFEL